MTFAPSLEPEALARAGELFMVSSLVNHKRPDLCVVFVRLAATAASIRQLLGSEQQHQLDNRV